MSTLNFAVDGWSHVTDNFEKMDLKSDLLRGIIAHGFETPSKLQQVAIEPAIKGHNIIVKSGSVATRTTTICIAALQQVDVSLREVQIIMLSPTRELALHAYEHFNALSQFTNVKSYACVGGANVRVHIEKLKEGGVQVIVGTPGRIHDLIQRGVLSVEHVKVFCLDEIDELLAREFGGPIEEVFKAFNPDVQVISMTTTMPSDVLEFTRRFIRDPIQIVQQLDERQGLQGLKQFYLLVEEKDKIEAFSDLVETLVITQAKIYCRTRQIAESVAHDIGSQDISLSVMHEDMEQSEQEALLKQYWSGISRILVITDAAAGSVKTSPVSHVALIINYDLPTKAENYILRTGRFGRFGRKGVAISFVTQQDMGMLKEIEDFYGTKINEMPLNVADLV